MQQIENWYVTGEIRISPLKLGGIKYAGTSTNLINLKTERTLRLHLCGK